MAERHDARLAQEASRQEQRQRQLWTELDALVKADRRY